jgi:hypothetical protein
MQSYLKQTKNHYKLNNRSLRILYLEPAMARKTKLEPAELLLLTPTRQWIC